MEGREKEGKAGEEVEKGKEGKERGKEGMRSGLPTLKCRRIHSFSLFFQS